MFWHTQCKRFYVHELTEITLRYKWRVCIVFCNWLPHCKNIMPFLYIMILPLCLRATVLRNSAQKVAFTDNPITQNTVPWKHESLIKIAYLWYLPMLIFGFCCAQCIYSWVRWEDELSYQKSHQEQTKYNTCPAGLRWAFCGDFGCLETPQVTPSPSSIHLYPEARGTERAMARSMFQHYLWCWPSEMMSHISRKLLQVGRAGDGGNSLAYTPGLPSVRFLTRLWLLHFLHDHWRLWRLPPPR